MNLYNKLFLIFTFFSTYICCMEQDIKAHPPISLYGKFFEAKKQQLSKQLLDIISTEVNPVSVMPTKYYQKKIKNFPFTTEYMNNGTAISQNVPIIFTKLTLHLLELLSNAKMLKKGYIPEYIPSEKSNQGKDEILNFLINKENIQAQINEYDFTKILSESTTYSCVAMICHKNIQFTHKILSFLSNNKAIVQKLFPLRDKEFDFLMNIKTQMTDKYKIVFNPKNKKQMNQAGKMYDCLLNAFIQKKFNDETLPIYLSIIEKTKALDLHHNYNILRKDMI